MKIKLTIELDLPDEANDWSDAELRQVVFDSYINYATCQHMQDAVHWMARSAKSEPDSAGRAIAEIHSNWGDICSQATWTMERI